MFSILHCKDHCLYRVVACSALSVSASILGYTYSSHICNCSWLLQAGTSSKWSSGAH